MNKVTEENLVSSHILYQLELYDGKIDPLQLLAEVYLYRRELLGDPVSPENDSIYNELGLKVIYDYRDDNFYITPDNNEYFGFGTSVSAKDFRKIIWNRFRKRELIKEGG